jgi:hypothetical protein
LEGVGKESGKKKDPGQDRKTNGQTHQNKDILVCLGDDLGLFDLAQGQTSVVSENWTNKSKVDN